MNERCRETQVFHDRPAYRTLRGTQRECRKELKERGFRENVGLAAVDDDSFSDIPGKNRTEIFKRFTTSS